MTGKKSDAIMASLRIILKGKSNGADMQELKFIIAKNIQTLRQAKGMTQVELAEKLNYSDKSVSKWERGESLPDITVLKGIADLFEVSLDYLVEAEHGEGNFTLSKAQADRKKKGAIILLQPPVFFWWLFLLLCFISYWPWSFPALLIHGYATPTGYP